MSILEALSILVDDGLPSEAVMEIVDNLLRRDEFDGDDEIKALALLSCRAEWENDIDLSIEEGYNDCVFEVAGREYLVLDEDERDVWWDDALENVLDECVEGSDGTYFDREAWKRDARMDGAGHALSSYDGNEYEVGAGSNYYFIYRLN